MAPPVDPPAPLAVILAGDGARARDWARLMDRSPRLARVARVARRAGDAAAMPGGVPVFPGLAAALEAFPEAAVAAALPPMAALDAALALAGAGRRGLVEAPLPLRSVPLPAGAGGIQVAHGWVTLPGLAAVRQALGAPGLRALSVRVRGLPETPGGDLPEAVAHAAALVRRLVPGAHPVSAMVLGDGVLEATLAGGRVPLALRVEAAGHGVEVRVEAARGPVTFTAEGDLETLARPGAAGPRTRPVPPAPARALHQLLDPAAAGGDDLGAGLAAAALARRLLDLAGRRSAPTRRALDQAGALTARPGVPLAARLGLAGPLPKGPPAPILPVPQPAAPFEGFAFDAGLKPVVFLTLRPEDEARVRAGFPGAHVVRRARRVAVGPLDAWDDHRDRGAPRVELYVSRDPARAEEAARIQAEGDPSAAVEALGALMGYPRCCVAAFAGQGDRSHNTWNRYATAARTGPGPWPAALNDLFAMVAPFFPCRYDCPEAARWAEAVLAAVAAAEPEVARGLRAALAHPVLYFDDAHQVILDGHLEDGWLVYRGVFVPPGSPEDLRRLAGGLGGAGRLRLDDDALRLEPEGGPARVLVRTDPGLGLLAPFRS